MILFDHYPKAGGTTVRRWLLKCFDDHEVFNLNDRAQSKSRLAFMNNPRRLDFKCLLAHSGFELIKYMPPGTEAITVIREPIERIISWYRYSAKTPGMPGHKFAQDHDIIEYAEEFKLGDAMSNYFGSLERMESRYSVIGTVQNLGQFMVACGVRYKLKGWQPETSNESTHPLEVTDEQIAKLRMMARGDIRIWKQFTRKHGALYVDRQA